MTRVIASFLGCLFVASAGCDPVASRPAPSASSKPEIDPLYPVGEFSLTERSGKGVRESDLLGKVWIASFVFTRCTGPCPQVTATMGRLQSELKDLADVRLVTFTVDPQRDDVAELTRYANHFRADPERWLFLTGKEKEIHALMKESFKLAINRNDKAKPGDEFDHSTRIVIVDRRGLIRGYFDGVRDERLPPGEAEEHFEAGMARLKEKLMALLSE
jgi:protein SCO1